MGLSDVSGVFSRYFIVGFFAPSFFGLAALKIWLSDEWLPKAIQPDETSSFLAIGGLALLVALVLLGLNYPIIRLVEGYPLIRPALSRFSQILRFVGAVLTDARALEFDELQRLKTKPETRRWAAWQLQVLFPCERKDILPTRLGNAIRAFELMPRRLWGLSSIQAWPRIEALLGEEERELEADARGEFAFFVNAAVVSLLAGGLLLADGFVNDPHAERFSWVYLVPFALSYLLYRGSVGAAVRWGERVQSAFDLHRIELYKQLGLRDATSFADERDVAAAVNQCFLWGVPIPEGFKGAGTPAAGGTQARSGGGSSSGSPGSE